MISIELSRYITNMRIKYYSLAKKCALERDEYKRQCEELKKENEKLRLKVETYSELYHDEIMED